MVKKIRMLGMEMDNFTLREEIVQSESFYHKQELNIIRTVSIDMLSLAADSPIVRGGIRQADLIVVGDSEILTEAGIYSAQRIREASEHGFMRAFLKDRIREQSSFFLVAQDQQELERLMEFLKKKYENMILVGTCFLEACSRDYDMMINEINAAAPDIILSVLTSPQEDALLMEEKSKIRARIWYSMSGYEKTGTKKQSFLCWFQQLIHKGRFKNAVHNYEERNE